MEFISITRVICWAPLFNSLQLFSNRSLSLPPFLPPLSLPHSLIFFSSPYYPDAATPVWGVGAGKAVSGLRMVSSVQGQMQARIQRKKRGGGEWESTNKEAGEVTRLKLMQGGVRIYLLASSLKNTS